MMSMDLSFGEAMRLMRSRDPQSQEDGFHQLLPHAAEQLGSGKHRTVRDNPDFDPRVLEARHSVRANSCDLVQPLG
jgi:hypothetical protein